jgi:hypothetical protein
MAQSAWGIASRTKHSKEIGLNEDSSIITYLNA